MLLLNNASRREKRTRRQLSRRFLHEKFILTFYFHYSSGAGCLAFVSRLGILIVSQRFSTNLLVGVPSVVACARGPVGLSGPVPIHGPTLAYTPHCYDSGCFCARRGSPGTSFSFVVDANRYDPSPRRLRPFKVNVWWEGVGVFVWFN